VHKKLNCAILGHVPSYGTTAQNGASGSRIFWYPLCLMPVSTMDTLLASSNSYRRSSIPSLKNVGNCVPPSLSKLYKYFSLNFGHLEKKKHPAPLLTRGKWNHDKTVVPTASLYTVPAALMLVKVFSYRCKMRQLVKEDTHASPEHVS